MRTLAGQLTVQTLRILATLPPSTLLLLAEFLWPFYFLINYQKIKRLHVLWSNLPVRVTTYSYYRTRLKLVLIHNSYYNLCFDTDHSHKSCHPFTNTKATATLPIHNFKIKNAEYYKQAMESKHPVLIISLHMGPFELLQHWLHQQAITNGKKSYLIVADTFSKPLTHYLNTARAKNGQYIISNHQTKLGLRNWLKNKGVLKVLIDQTRTKDSLLKTNMGFSLPWPQSLISWALQQGAICLPTLIIPTDRQLDEPLQIPVTKPFNFLDFEIFISEPLHKDQMDWAKNIQAWLENSLALYPSIYNWSYQGISINPKTS